MADQYAVNLKNGSVLRAVDGKARPGYMLMSASENEEYEAWAASVKQAQADKVEPSMCPRCPKFGPHRAAAEAVADAKAFVVTDYEVETEQVEPDAEVEQKGLPAGLGELLNGSDD